MLPFSADGTTFRVGELIDRAKEQLAQLANPHMPIMVEGFVSFNATTAKYDQKYFSLCQYSDPNSPTGKPTAKLDAVIFSNRYAVILTQLRQVGLDFSPDLRAVFLGYLDIYKPFGKLQLVVSGIDVVRTRQITEGAKDILRAKLKAEGIFEKNRRLSPVLVPLRIALVTSRGSAAESDFMTKLRTEKYRFVVETFYVNTSGQNVAFSIPEALISINGRPHDFDVVVLARGGGDHVDLANFSLEGPVRAVATCKVPVWAAIGHSTDDVLVNEVAARVLANPNDAASELNDALEKFDTTLDEYSRGLLTAAQRCFERAVGPFERAKSNLHGSAIKRLGGYRSVPVAKLWELRMGVKVRAGDRRSDLLSKRRDFVDTARRLCDAGRWGLGRFALALESSVLFDGLRHRTEEVSRARLRLDDSTRTAFASKAVQLEFVKAKLEGIDPERVLEMGYALLYSHTERIISVHRVAPGDDFEAQLSDGRIKGRVIELSESPISLGP